MSRPDRWWRPSTNRRPPLRARQRQMYTQQEFESTFDVGVEIGKVQERKRQEQRDETLRRLAEACEEGPDAVTALAREVGVMPEGDVSPIGDTDPEQLVDEVERWLREQE